MVKGKVDANAIILRLNMIVISLRPNPIVNVNTNVLKPVSYFDIIFVCTFHGIVRACTV
jgi:hypothetical protein